MDFVDLSDVKRNPGREFRCIFLFPLLFASLPFRALQTVLHSFLVLGRSYMFTRARFLPWFCCYLQIFPFSLLFSPLSYPSNCTSLVPSCDCYLFLFLSLSNISFPSSPLSLLVSFKLYLTHLLCSRSFMFTSAPFLPLWLLHLSFPFVIYFYDSLFDLPPLFPFPFLSCSSLLPISRPLHHSLLFLHTGSSSNHHHFYFVS